MAVDGFPLFTIGVEGDGKPWVKATNTAAVMKDPATYSKVLGQLINEMRDQLHLTDEQAFQAFLHLALQQAAPESTTPQRSTTAQRVKLSGKNPRSGRREIHQITLADLTDVAANEDVVYLTFKDSVLGIIMHDAYQAAKTAMGKRDFKYFIDEANLNFALYAYPADLKALHTIFAYAREHQLYTELKPDETAAADVPDTPAEFDKFMEAMFDDMGGDPDDTGNVLPFRPKDK